MILDAADDGFHPIVKDSDDWAETAWFAASAPESDLVVWFYPLFRPGLGVMSCGIYVFGPGKSEPWEMLYYRQAWQQPITAEVAGPSDFRLANSLSYETLEPLRSYRLGYDDGDEFSADLVFAAIQDAHPLGVAGGVGHLDQFGHITGTIIVGGRRLVIDGIGMRDRTWGPRRESKHKTRLGYSYGANKDGRGFHLSVRFDSSNRSDLMAGFRLEGGQEYKLDDGERQVYRDERGRPDSIVLTVREGARSYDIRGEIRGQMTLYTSPYIVFVSLVAWTLPDGTVVYGEDQDTWSQGRLRTFRQREGFARPAPALPTT